MCTCHQSAPSSSLETLVNTARQEFLALVERERNLRDMHQSEARARKDLQQQNAINCNQETYDVIMQRAEEAFLRCMIAAEAQYSATVERAEQQLLEQFASVFDLFNTTAVEVDRVRTEAQITTSATKSV